MKETILENSMSYFKANGLKDITREKIISALNITDETFAEYFKDENDLVKKAIAYEIKKEKIIQDEMLAKATNAIEEILSLIERSSTEIQTISPDFYSELIEKYPEAWEIITEELNSGSYHTISNIINKGIQQGHFRKDINITIVTKVILENVNVLINTKVFPTERFNLREVYRGIYLYYIRGLCTEKSINLTEKYFS
jgi:hypothetical protein